MKRQIILITLFVILCRPSPDLFAWVSVGDGIDYQGFTAPGPNNLFVSRMLRGNTNATIDTSIANNTMSGAREIVRNQAARQDDAITWWGGSWGATNRVAVAINGGFFDMTTGVIAGGQIQSGWYAHWFADRGAFSGFAWKTDRTAFHGQCVDHTAARVYVKFVSNGATQAIDGINQAPGTSDLVIFTPQYNSRTPSGSRTEVLVEMTRPNLTTSGTGYSSGTIRSVTQNTGSTWIPFDHIVLSAAGSDGTTLKTNSTVGSQIRVYQELIESNQPDVQGYDACQTETGVDWSNVFASINTNYHFLENNEVRIPDAVTHPGYIGYVNLNPRTAICWNATYVFFVICDGRTSESIGMSCETLGNWAKSTLGATDGVNLDGGGSSTMVVNGSVMNVPSDGPERPVCNGVMMVNVQPKQQSTQFIVSQAIFATAQTDCRLGPGTNYASLATIASGAQGTIVNHAIMGVHAKGDYWWKCNFAGTIGWVAQSFLSPTGAHTAPTITQQPQTHTVCAGTDTSFTVTATGEGTLAYQWQRNNANLTDGGRFAGTTTDTLTISTTAATDAGNYRCVVSNAYGSANSDQATLNLLTCNPLCLTNPGFEDGFTAGVGNGWTKFTQAGDVTCTEETTEHHSGSRCQEIYSPDNTCVGGVYQQFVATPGQPYVVKAWIKVYCPQGSNIAEGFFGIDPTGGTDPNSASILWASKPWEYWSQDTWSVLAQGSFITVYLRGHSTKTPDKLKVAYVWVDDVEVVPGPPTDATPEVLGSTSIRWRWTDLSIETGYRVRDSAGADKSGLLPADTTRWDETTGIAPNTQYTRFIRTINDCAESGASAGQTARSLSAPPGAGSITPSAGTSRLNENVIWTAVGGFGAGTIQYYRYAWDCTPTHEWTNLEPQWSSGTMTTSPTDVGTWYLHVQGYNADNIPNGTYDYEVTAGNFVLADFDLDNDVDQYDLGRMTPCLFGSAVPYPVNCDGEDLDKDDDVDMEDFGIFQRCYSGENIPAAPNCAD